MSNKTGTIKIMGEKVVQFEKIYGKSAITEKNTHQNVKIQKMTKKVVRMQKISKKFVRIGEIEEKLYNFQKTIRRKTLELNKILGKTQNLKNDRQNF